PLILAGRPAPRSSNCGRRPGESRQEGSTRRSCFHLVRNDDAVPPRSLGLIKGGVGGTQHFLPVLAVVGKYPDAHGNRDGSDPPALVLDLEVLHVPAGLFGPLRDSSLLGRSHARRQLLAAMAGDDIRARRTGQ